jgi:hypothetical protein
MSTVLFAKKEYSQYGVCKACIHEIENSSLQLELLAVTVLNTCHAKQLWSLLAA